MIITTDYFVGMNYVPGLSGTGYANQANVTQMQSLISVYVKPYLYALLGVTLADKLMEYVDDEEADTDLALDALLAELADDDKKVSPIAGYVYYHFIRFSQSHTTATGNEVTIDYENAKRADTHNKIVESWNVMVDQSSDVHQFIIDNADDYPDFDVNRKFAFMKINIFNL